MFIRPRFGSSAGLWSASLVDRFSCSGSSALTGFARNFTGADLPRNSSTWTNLGTKLGLLRSQENIASPYSLHFRNSIHSGKTLESEDQMPPRSSEFFREFGQDKGGGMQSGSMDFVQSLIRGGGNINYPSNQSSFYPRQFEANADVVHIKLMRNNSFVTLTDSKGNRKVGVSAGQVAGKAAKLTRFSGEAAAENIGQKVRQMKTKSVVIKVNGFCMFKRKKDSILSFREGYSNSRLDVNPVVYIEDTTRKPHNGCRRPKKRRI